MHPDAPYLITRKDSFWTSAHGEWIEEANTDAPIEWIQQLLELQQQEQNAVNDKIGNLI